MDDLREKDPGVAELEEDNSTLTADNAQEIDDDEGHEILIGNDEDGEESAAKENEGGVVPGPVKREQSPEANAAFAEMRREAEAAKRALAERDAWVAQNFGQSHGIHNWEQYQAAIAHTHKQQQEARQQALQQRPGQVYKEVYDKLIDEGYDDALAKEVASSKATAVEQWMQVQSLHGELSAIKSQEQSRQAEAKHQELTSQILADYNYLRGKYGELVPTNLGELDDATVDMVKKGMPLKAAWLAAHEDEVVRYASGKGAQKVVRQVNSKAHLDSEKGGGSGVGKQVQVSAEKLRVWRALGYSDKEARQREARYQRKERG